MADIYTQQQVRNAGECINSCIELRNSEAVESVLRHNLSSYLRGMFEDNPDWVSLHIRGSEAQVEFSRNQNLHRGFVDSLVGATAIEYEGHLNNKEKFRTGYGQVEEYCAGLLNLGYPPDNIIGILSDTVQWYAYKLKLSNGAVETSYSAEDFELIEIESLNCETDINSNYRLLDFLNKNLGRIGSRILDAESINLDLGFKSQLAREYLPGLRNTLQEISVSRPEYSNLIESVWNRFVNSVRESDTSESFDTEFYIDEYYLTTVAKFLCANVISGTALISNDEELKSILNGDFFKLKGYANVVEYDFFGWLNNLPIHETIIRLCQKIQMDLRAYDYSFTIQEDLFSNLFSELAKKSRRLLLGQSMTPSWLANSIIKEVVDEINDEPKLIDMCCGSGTFIVETIKIVSESFSDNTTSEEKVSRILSCISGFDIDPLAVILARINWLIVAKPYIQDSRAENINIPIYNADSLFAVTPVSTNEDQIESFSLRLLNEEVRLPKSLLSPSNKNLFEKILDIGYSVIMELSELPSGEFYSQTLNRLTGQLNQELNDNEKGDFTEFMQEYYGAIFRLHSQGQNGIWNFLILNSYRPALVEKSFNGLVSNPPWLTLSRIADNPYNDFLKNLAEELNIRPPAASFLHTELASIFLLSSIEKYLMNDAVVGCVLPGTILSGDHHQPFRNMDYRDSEIHFKISKIWDLDKSIFNNRGITLFGKKINEPNIYPIPSKLINSELEFEDINLYLSSLDTKTAWSTFNINSSNENSYNSKFTQGADIMPRSLYFHDIDDYNPSEEFTRVIPINKQNSNQAYLLKDSKKFPDFRIESCRIENSVLFPVMISNSLLPFHITSLPLAILPIEKHEEKWRAIPSSTMVSMSTAFKRYINRASSQYVEGNNIETLWSWLDTRSKLSKQEIPENGFIICSGTGGEYVCAHYLSHEEINFNRLVLDQTVNYYHTTNKNEAIYLTGILNSASISNAIRGFQAEGNFGARHIHSLPYRIIEPFDGNNGYHLEVVRATIILKNELTSFFNHTSDPKVLRLLNPNESSIAYKRRRIREIISSLDSFDQYNQSCNVVIFN